MSPKLMQMSPLYLSLRRRSASRRHVSPQCKTLGGSVSHFKPLKRELKAQALNIHYLRP